MEIYKYDNFVVFYKNGEILLSPFEVKKEALKNFPIDYKDVFFFHKHFVTGSHVFKTRIKKPTKQNISRFLRGRGLL